MAYDSPKHTGNRSSLLLVGGGGLGALATVIASAMASDPSLGRVRNAIVIDDLPRGLGGRTSPNVPYRRPAADQARLDAAVERRRRKEEKKAENIRKSEEGKLRAKR